MKAIQSPNSSNVDSVVYYPEHTLLIVEFKKGGVYSYKNVNAEMYYQLEQAESVGSYIAKNIKSNKVCVCQKLN